MNGLDFIRKANETHQDKIYFIMSGFDFNDEIDAAIEAGLVEGFFTKPFQKEQVDEAKASRSFHR